MNNAEKALDAIRASKEGDMFQMGEVRLVRVGESAHVESAQVRVDGVLTLPLHGLMDRDACLVCHKMGLATFDPPPSEWPEGWDDDMVRVEWPDGVDLEVVFDEEKVTALAAVAVGIWLHQRGGRRTALGTLNAWLAMQSGWTQPVGVA